MGYWRDGKTNNVDRLYHCIDDKARKYRSLAERLNIPYVVAVFGEFEAALDFHEICLCLLDEETGLFGLYPELSGVLYFEESSGRYLFNYADNPNALQPIQLPLGIFPPEAT